MALYPQGVRVILCGSFGHILFGIVKVSQQRLKKIINRRFSAFVISIGQISGNKVNFTVFITSCTFRGGDYEAFQSKLKKKKSLFQIIKREFSDLVVHL